MYFPKILKYSKHHTWIKLQNETALIGLTDYAQDKLGEVFFVNLPKIGSEIMDSKAFATVESAKALQEVHSPVSGIVEDINGELEFEPMLINKRPYDEGWMVRVRLANKIEDEALMSADDYKQWFKDNPE